MPSSRQSWLGWALLAALALHAWSTGFDSLPEMLWSCHVASTLLAVSILLGWRTGVAAGWLFHLGIGLPAWAVEIVVTRGTFGGAAVIGHLLATSILVHALPLVAGAVWLQFPRAPLPRRAIALAWLIQIGLIPISRVLTPPNLNINLAHGIWPSVSGMFSRLWLFQSVISLLCLASLLLVASLIQWCWRCFSRGAEQQAAAETRK